MCFYQHCPRHGVVTQLIVVKTNADVMELLSEGMIEAKMPEAPAAEICNRPQRTVAIA